MEEQCLFCAIASGQMPSFKVYDDDYVSAVLDIRPATKGHTLVFPKKHYTLLGEMPYNEMAHIFNIARTLITVLINAMRVQGINLVYSAGPAAGQRTPHLFLSLIPRSDKDNVSIHWEGKQMGEDELKSIQQQIINTLSSLGGISQPETQQKKEVVQEAPEVLEEYYDIGDRPARYW